MLTEVQRRRQGRIAARRCWNESRIAVDERTRDALERCAVRYMLKAIGLEPEEEVTADDAEECAAGRSVSWPPASVGLTDGCGTPGEITDAPLLPLGRLQRSRQTRAPRAWETGAREDWD